MNCQYRPPDTVVGFPITCPGSMCLLEPGTRYRVRGISKPSEVRVPMAEAAGKNAAGHSASTLLGLTARYGLVTDGEGEVRFALRRASTPCSHKCCSPCSAVGCTSRLVRVSSTLADGALVSGKLTA